MFGSGQVLACQVPLLGRLEVADAGGYDPVAERLLVYLIEGPVPAATPDAPTTVPAAVRQPSR